MSDDPEKIKRLVTFKKKLEGKVEKLESELEELQAMLEAINSILLEKGFKRAEIMKAPVETSVMPPKETITEPAPVPAQPPIERENIFPLKTVTGELLASLHVSEDSLLVTFPEDKCFNINTPPFTHFLVERVFAKMQEKDSELVRTGQLPPEKIFCYNIVREGDIIREILIKNADADRLRELKSSIRWTLEKMYEKMENEKLAEPA